MERPFPDAEVLAGSKHAGKAMEAAGKWHQCCRHKADTDLNV